MKVCFVVSDLSPSGGVNVLVQHATALAADHGFDVDLVTMDARDGAELRAAVPCHVRSVEEAQTRSYDIAIATWWETAALAWRLQARRRVAFLQSAEDCFYTGEQPLERLGAAAAQRTAEGYIVVSGWLADLVAGLRPGVPVALVPNAIDKSVFDGRRIDSPDLPMRVLVEGQPSLWFKGVQEALAAVGAAQGSFETTLVCPQPEGVDAPPGVRVVGGLGPHEMRDLYANTDLLVKLSRLEGLGLAPVEAFHHGVPCVVTPYGGHADYLRHGENGFLVGFDDAATVTRAVERIGADRSLRERLSRGALATAADWPSRAAATQRFAAALEAVAGGEAEPGLAAAMDAWRVTAEQDRPVRRTAAAETGELRGALSWHEDALAETRDALQEQIEHVARLNALVGEVEEARAELNEMLLARMAELEQLKASRVYRATAAARSLVERVRT